MKTPILDLIVFNKFKDLLGGRMRWMVSGGAPLSPGAHLYLRVCFGVPLLQGYGLTETCGAGAVMFPIDDSVGTVGPPVPCVGSFSVFKLFNIYFIVYILFRFIF